MTTIISNNGSHWAGEEPDSIEQLLDVLGYEPLDPSFEDYGNFISTELRRAIYIGNGEYVEKELIYPESPSMVRFWGNFYALSHCFQIDTDEPEMIERLTNAIRANQTTSAYVSASKERGAHAKAVSKRRIRRQEDDVSESPAVVDAAADQQLTLAL